MGLQNWSFEISPGPRLNSAGEKHEDGVSSGNFWDGNSFHVRWWVPILR
jgi:hypothetical protein